MGHPHHVAHHLEDIPLAVIVVLLAGHHVMVPLHTVVEIPCLPPAEDPQEDPLESHLEAPLHVTGMTIMGLLLTVGTPQGIMIVEDTVNVRGRGHQATITITMAADILHMNVAVVVEVV